MSQIGFGSRVRVFADGETKTNACGAIYEVKAGKRTEMAYHLDNEKIVYVLMGKAILCVIKDGILRKKEFVRGETIFVSRGLAHQFEATEDTMLIEFGNNPEAYRGDLTDTFVVEKGTPVETQEEAEPTVVMSEEDKAAVKQAVEQAKKEMAVEEKSDELEAVEEAVKVTKAKKTKKKRRSKKSRKDN